MFLQEVAYWIFPFSLRWLRCAGMSSTRTGRVRGSRPLGFTFPYNTSAMAFPASLPQYHACNIPLTEPTHGIDTAEPCFTHELRMNKRWNVFNSQPVCKQQYWSLQPIFSRWSRPGVQATGGLAYQTLRFPIRGRDHQQRGQRPLSLPRKLLPRSLSLRRFFRIHPVAEVRR